MFKLLFKYPPVTFTKGTFLLLGSWPVWILALTIGAVGAVLGWMLWRRREGSRTSLNRTRIFALWSLQTAVLAILLLLLWQPAISVPTLKTQQNVIAVVLDDSRSMAVADVGEEREQQALRLLQSTLLPELKKNFQLRIYALNSGIVRIGNPANLHAQGAATEIGAGLRELADEAAALPIGAIVLLSDGADTSGGIDESTLNELRRRHLPVNTIGFGRASLSHDIELDSFSAPSKALADSRVEVTVGIRQNSFGGERANLVLTSDGRIVASRQIALTNNPAQTETLEFNAGKGGLRQLEARIDVLPGEENPLNNRLTAVMSVDGEKRRILYVEGEPRWEYKFLRRAVEDDPALAVVSMLRTTQNKIYRQGISTPNELVDGFPTKEEDLFGYDALMLGSIESGFFSAAQQQAMEAFVNRRGGGLLFLGGRSALADGAYGAPPFAQLLPVVLPNRKNTFSRKLVAAELTAEGKKTLLCRIEPDLADSINHWNVLPYLADFQDPGTPKPGAVVLARVDAGGNHPPLLITENYGRGRTAVFSTGGSWRWRMQQPVGDTSHAAFWRQLLRWTAGAAPSPVVASLSTAKLEDTGRLQIRAEVRDKSYRPVSDAEATANIIGPDGASHAVALHVDAMTQGVYSTEWEASQVGTYVAEITGTRAGTELGHDVIAFQRENGAAENFNREQNRELLQKLAEDTSGRYYTPGDATRVPDEISFSEAGISARETMDLWNMPIVFLLLVTVRAAEWLLRRRWGLV